jgi:predicted SnoaL-like aldol condensation-catalyzing enzyme
MRIKRWNPADGAGSRQRRRRGRIAAFAISALVLVLSNSACSSAAPNPPATAPPSGVASTDDAQTAKNKALVAGFYDQLFLKSNLDVIDQYLGPVYRQHNPTVADGAGPLRGLVTELKASLPGRSTTFEHVIAQGDLVLLHTHSRPNPGAPGMALTDIFRVTNGKISEHWDTIQTVPAATASGNDMFSTFSGPPVSDSQAATLTASTETLVRQYFTQLNTNRDLAAIDRYVSSSLYEHDPAVATGSAALKTAYARRFTAAPQSTASSPLFITEGDLSAVRYHYQSDASDLGQAVTEILRVRDGKIVERWTVSQPVPAHSANQNTMF